MSIVMCFTEIYSLCYYILIGHCTYFFSMGGHGALICALKCPGKFKSVSAFAPISNPIQAPWGQKAFRGYLGENKKDWEVS